MTKALPLISAIYVISPVDFIPGAVLPFVGTMDDLAVAFFGLKLFIEFSPASIVQEHLRQLQEGQSNWDVVNNAAEGDPEHSQNDGEVVEGEYSVVEGED